MRTRAAAAALVAAGLAACTTVEPPMPQLAGTRWELVSIQSMDDAQGTVRATDPARYTLDFAADGRATARLDCNRGTATWQAQPSAGNPAGRVSGSLVFGPWASTRAMCPPDSLAPRLVGSLPHVRSYVIEAGRLHLSLMADGGILTWSPAP